MDFGFISTDIGGANVTVLGITPGVLRNNEEHRYGVRGLHYKCGLRGSQLRRVHNQLEVQAHGSHISGETVVPQWLRSHDGGFEVRIAHPRSISGFWNCE